MRQCEPSGSESAILKIEVLSQGGGVGLLPTIFVSKINEIKLINGESAS